MLGVELVSNAVVDNAFKSVVDVYSLVALYVSYSVGLYGSLEDVVFDD